MRRDPLARAMRPDKATMAGVALTLGIYRAGRATAEIPIWRMLATPLQALRERAAVLADRLGPAVEATEVRSTVGGGSLPGETMPSMALALTTRSADRTLGALRRGSPAVIGRIEGGRVLLDLRTVPPSSDEALTTAVTAVLR
jgi:L-seryl-tRNA(Ser) seleniumtransferase